MSRVGAQRPTEQHPSIYWEWALIFRRNIKKTAINYTGFYDIPRPLLVTSHFTDEEIEIHRG